MNKRDTSSRKTEVRGNGEMMVSAYLREDSRRCTTDDVKPSGPLIAKKIPLKTVNEKSCSMLFFIFPTTYDRNEKSEPLVFAFFLESHLRVFGFICVRSVQLESWIAFLPWSKSMAMCHYGKSAPAVSDRHGWSVRKSTEKWRIMCAKW